MSYYVPARHPWGRYAAQGDDGDLERQLTRLRPESFRVPHLGQFEDLFALPDVGVSFLEPAVQALPDWASAGFSLTEPLIASAGGFPEWAAGASYSLFDSPTWASFNLPAWITEAPTAVPELPSLAETTLPNPTVFAQPTPTLAPVPAAGTAPDASTFSWASFWKGLPTVLTAGASLAAAGAKIAGLLNPPEAPSAPGAYASRYGYWYLGPNAAGSTTRYPTAVPGLPYPPGSIPPNMPYFSPTAPRPAMAPQAGALQALMQPGPLGVPVWAWLGGGVTAAALLSGRRRRGRRPRP